MIIDGNKKEMPNTVYDVLIAGAGAAGITLAMNLGKDGFKVALVESGDFEVNMDVQNLYDGTVSGNLPLEDRYLTSSRWRFFGGSTNFWAGWCRPFDALDFKEREWVPNSGWPIQKHELEPEYRESEKLVEINPFPQLDENQYFFGKDDNKSLGLRAPYFQWSPPTRFGDKYRNNIIDAENIHLYKNSNIIDFGAHPNKKALKSAEIKSNDGEVFNISAKYFILACGGIENARIMLAAKSEYPQGIGNERDVVGRYFMEHPHINETGSLLIWELMEFKSYGDWIDFRRLRRENNVRSSRVLSISEPVQEREKLLNISVELRPIMELKDIKDTGSKEFIENLARHSSGFIVNKKLFHIPHHSKLVIRAEQVPEKSNRVTLSDEKDALGIPKVHLHNYVSTEQLDNYKKSLELMASSLGSRRQGRIEIEVHHDSALEGGYHHIGTTRMGNDASTSVVDENCKVHELDNLYIAGSSVFPTSGFANPTLTLVALSLRLAKHLKTKL